MYAKVFRSLWSGSLGAHWEGWTVFVFLLAHADAEGFIEMTPEAISRISGLPRDVVDRGLEILEAADPLSRSPEADGARLQRLDAHRPWGWLIVNYRHYRSLRDAEAVRAENRKRQKDFRARGGAVTDGNAPSRAVTPEASKSRHGEEEGEGEVEAPPPKATTTEVRAFILSGQAVRFDGNRSESLTAEIATELDHGAPLLPSVHGWSVAVTAHQLAEWSKDFPGVSVLVELGKMRAWLSSNPTRRKTARGIPRFAVNWLSREQDRSRGVGGAVAPARPSAARGRSDAGYAEANLKGGSNG